MITHDKEIVSVLRARLAEKVGRDRFDLWFGANTCFLLRDDRLTIAVPDSLSHDFVRANFRGQIQQACVELLGVEAELIFEIDPALAGGGESETQESADSGAESARTSSGSATRRRRDAGPRKGGKAHAAASQTLGHRRRFSSLSSFIKGPQNQLALSSAEMVGGDPGCMSPLLIHGPTGVGKTHLLEGIWTTVRKQRGGRSVVYLSSEQFTTYFLSALRGSGLPSFRQKYRGVGVLIIDDLQFFIGKRSTRIELLHTIDTLLRDGRQLVFSADRSLDELAPLGRELITRLESGMVSPIAQPDRATRAGIVRQLAHRMGMRVPDDVQRYVAMHLTQHARELSGALCRLRATSRALGQPITLATAEEALVDMIHASERMIRLPDIEKTVCELFGVTPDALHSKRKDTSVSHPRMLAMWLARKHTRSALSEIGRFFGRRSHSTVVSAKKRVEDWMANDKSVELADRTSSVEEVIRRAELRLMVG